jgi:hypothetical protein
MSLPPSSGCKPVGTTPCLTFHAMAKVSGAAEIDVKL